MTPELSRDTAEWMEKALLEGIADIPFIEGTPGPCHIGPDEVTPYTKFTMGFPTRYMTGTAEENGGIMDAVIRIVRATLDADVRIAENKPVIWRRRPEVEFFRGKQNDTLMLPSRMAETPESHPFHLYGIHREDMFMVSMRLVADLGTGSRLIPLPAL
jgi:hypothetical protein